MIKNPGENFIESRQIGIKGLNTLLDPGDITDQESSDMSNIVFDSGIIAPRGGSALYAKKPTGETGNAVQIIESRDSEGKWYLLALYDSFNIYAWAGENGGGDYWVKINQSYSFTTPTRCGYQAWLQGQTLDLLYFNNGVDDMVRWRVTMGKLATQAPSGTTSITLTDASSFYSESHTASGISGNTITLSGQSKNNQFKAIYCPTGTALYYVVTGGNPIVGLDNNTTYYAMPQSGSNPISCNNTIALATTLANSNAGIVINLTGPLPAGTHTFYFQVPISISDGTTTVTNEYYTISGNVLSLVSGVSATVQNGGTVVPQIEDRPSVPKGKCFTAWNNSLCTANSVGNENTLQISTTNLPEDFTYAEIPGYAIQWYFIDGDPSINFLSSFGLFLVVGKENNLYRFSINENTSLNAQSGSSTPIVSGEGSGCASVSTMVQTMNSVYYPSGASGFVQLSPVSTGFSTAVQFQVLSFSINNMVINNLRFDNDSRAAYSNQKIAWTTGYQGQSINNLVLVYDMMRQAWTKFDSWNAKDIIMYKNDFYFISSIDGNVYQGLTGYNDNGNPYVAYFTTGRKNFGKQSLPKSADAIYVEGYLASASTLYVDVLYNERGGQLKKTYEINRSNPNVLFTPLTVEALAQTPLYYSALSEIDTQYIDTIGSFHCYLSIPNGLVFYNLQLKFYSNQTNSLWGLTGYSVNPTLKPVVPANLRLNSQ